MVRVGGAAGTRTICHNGGLRGGRHHAMTSLSRRLQRLESGYRQNDGLASDRRRLIQRQALRHLTTDQLRCLIELKKAPPRGRQLTSEEAAAAEAFNSAVEAECPMLACPFLILAIALAAFLGPSLQNAMIAIGVSAAPVFVRVSRGATLDAATNEYVEAARALGNPPWRVAVRHVLPNIVPPVMVQATLAIAGAIIAEAALSFLGLG